MKYKIFFLSLLIGIPTDSYANRIVLGKKSVFKINIIEESPMHLLSPYIINFLKTNKFKIYKISIMNKSDDCYLYNKNHSVFSFIEDKNQFMNYLPLLIGGLSFGLFGVCGAVGLYEIIDSSGLKPCAFFCTYLCTVIGITVSLGLLINIPMLRSDIANFIENHLFNSSVCVKPHELCEKYFIIKEEDLIKSRL